MLGSLIMQKMWSDHRKNLHKLSNPSIKPVVLKTNVVRKRKNADEMMTQGTEYQGKSRRCQFVGTIGSGDFMLTT
jgi:hypothetical protein